jgi:hypothetical protein
MLKKLKTTLIIITLIGFVIDASYAAYVHFGADIASSKIVERIGGE